MAGLQKVVTFTPIIVKMSEVYQETDKGRFSHQLVTSLFPVYLPNHNHFHLDQVVKIMNYTFIPWELELWHLHVLNKDWNLTCLYYLNIPIIQMGLHLINSSY